MMQSGRRVARRSFASGLRDAITPRLRVSEWADQYRVLSRVSTSEHGKWSTSRTPYLREIMDCLSDDHPAREVVFQKATQIGGTETGNNWVGSQLHQGVGTMMIVMPTSAGAKKASKTRISPMISDTPVLRGRVREAKSRDSGNTTLMKEFGDGAGVLIFAGANSANDLKSSPAGKLFLDEIEEYPDDVDGQGDPEELVTKRADTFARHKRYKCSTPTVVGGRIDRAYRASDQRIYYVPCPHCGQEQSLQFDRLRWETRKRWERVIAESGDVVEAQPDSPGATEIDTGELTAVWYECAGCSQQIFEHHKTQMLESGRWVAQNPGPDRAVGFKLNALYSPVGWFGWRDVVLAHLKAEKDTSGRLRKTFINTVLGEAYEDPGDSIEAHFLERRIEPWRVGEVVPAGALLLTAGCDVQGDRLEVRVWGYGRDDESWLIDRHIIYGASAMPETWASLEQLLDKTWPHDLGGTARIGAMAIDASDGNTTHFVRAFARKHASKRRVIAVKGQQVQGKPLLGKPTDQDVNWRGKIIRGGVKLWPMGSSTGKASFYARLRIGWENGAHGPEPGQSMPGYVHLPSGLPDEEFRQMVAEVHMTRYVRGHPKSEWHLPSGRRNEALDCRVMADAAAEYLGVRRMRWDDLERTLRMQSSASIADATEQQPATEVASRGSTDPVTAPDAGVAVRTHARVRRVRHGGFA